MISVTEAHARLMALFEPLGPEDVAVDAAAGRVLAYDLRANRTQPPFPSSAMDGYALRSIEGRAGAAFEVVGEAAAGRRYPKPVKPREAVRIFTGAPVPDGADTVVIQENTHAADGRVTLTEDAVIGAHIRPAGIDFKKGDPLRAPRRLSSADVALIGAMNVAHVPVMRKPIVALIATGNELVYPGETPRPDQIVASNHLGLKAMLSARGVDVRVLPIARDNAESLAASFACASDADAIITIGGASVGDYDLVQSTALSEGLDLGFYKIAMRPGKPLMAGKLRGIPLVGLPGNPVSAHVCAQVLLLPAIDRMLGLPSALAQTHPARLKGTLGKNGQRQHYLRAKVEVGLDGWLCTSFDQQDSSLLSVLSNANALLVRPPHDPPKEDGSKVEILWLS
ncbi:MAG: gephyrin-like molybdotransferase Glp [Pseudomonadota bacterium]